MPAVAISAAPEGPNVRGGRHGSPSRTEALRKLGWIPALAVFLVASAAGAWAQGGFSTPQPVGTTSAPQTVTVTAQVAGLVHSVQVLTEGVAGLDFAPGSGASTCVKGINVAVHGSCTESVTFKPFAPGLRVGAVVLLDDSNVVLGMAPLSGIGSGGIGVLVPGNVTTVAGVRRNWTSTKDGILATVANLDQPSSMTFDGAGNMYIADSAHNRIRKVTAPVAPALVGIISTIAGTGDASYSGDGGAATAATLSNPSGVALDGAGNLYIADTGNSVVRKIAAATGIISTVAGNGGFGYGGDGGKARSAELNQPQGVTLDAAGNLYIADTSNQRIRRVDAVTTIISTVAGNGKSSSSGDGKGTYSGDNGPATKAGLSLPYPVGFDLSGNMYIPDSANNRIRKVDALGIITTVAGNGAAGLAGDGGPATEAVLNTPSGVALDPAGNLYIADTQNTSIRKVHATNGIIGTLVSNGSSNTLSAAGILGSVQIYAPIGLYMDGSGDLYYADYYYMMIQKIQSNQSVLDFTSTPIQVESKSAPQLQVVENEGNAALDMTAFKHDANAAVDKAATTCSLTAPLDVDAFCQIGVIFAPSLSVVFPTGVNAEEVDANVFADGGTVLDAENFPLDIVAVGVATPVNATTTTLTSRPNPSTFGQSVTFTASVSSGATAGIPVGTVTFTDGTTTLAAAVPLNALGVAIYTTTTPLAVGAHTITATFTSATTANYLPSSGTLVQNVGEVTATKLASSANPSVLGASVTFTATVSVISGGAVTPDRSVTFFDGSKILGNVPLSTVTGTATYSTAALTNGLHAITATYGGDAPLGILGSTSPVLSQDVQAPTVAVVASNHNPSNYGETVTFTATVTTATGTVAPTGVVNFLDGGRQFGTASLVGTTGIGTFSTSSLAAGAHSITAAYQGSPDDGPSTSVAIPQTVDKAVTATTLTIAPNPAAASAPVVLQATVKVTQGVSTPSGAVTFTDTFNGQTIVLGAPVQLVGGRATINPSFAAGTHSIVASYAGDSNDGTSASAPAPLTVVQETVKFTSSPNPSAYGTPVQFTLSIATIGTTPATGTVNILEQGQARPIGTITLAGDPATGTFTTSALTAGTDVITGAYLGDGRYVAVSSSPVNQVVNLAQTSTAVQAAPSPEIAGAPVAIKATVKVTQGVSTPTGDVTFTDTFNGRTVPLGSPVPLAAGAATINPTLALGVHSIVATYAGDSNDAKSASPALALTVVQATTTATLSSSQNPSLVLAPVTFTSKVTGNGGVPTGKVNFVADGATMGAGTLDATGTASFTTAALLAGTHAITANYAGDLNDAASASNVVSQVVGKLPTVTDLGASTTTGPFPQVILVATILNSGITGPTPTGIVTFSNGTNVVGSSAVDSSGVASLTPDLPAGTYNLVAAYAGDADHNPSSSKPVSIAEPPAGFNLSVNPPKVSVAATKNVSVTVNLSSQSGFSDTIGLGCASLPAGVNCHFSSPSVALASNATAAPVTLTIDTNNPLGGGGTAMNAHSGDRGAFLAGLFLPLSLLFGAIFWRFRKRYAALMTTGLVLLLGCAAMMVSGCSGFSQSSATPGTYVIQVTGVGTKSDITHYQNVTLTITAK